MTAVVYLHVPPGDLYVTVLGADLGHTGLVEPLEKASISFDLAAVFPPTDEVGHFVISLAAAQNDLIDTITRLFPPDNPDDPRVTPAIRASLFRTLLAQIWETQDLVRAASKKPTIKKFMADMADYYPRQNLDGHELLAMLSGKKGTKNEQFLNLGRNSAYHYHKPGTTVMKKAVSGAISHGQLGAVTYEADGGMQTLRAEFADDIMLQAAVPGIDDVGLEALSDMAGQTATAIVHMAQMAISLWFTERGVELPDQPS